MAVVAVPLMGAVGITVDYSRVNGARAAFQVALDSPALMMSKDAQTKTDAERHTEAAKTFSALFNRPEVTDATVTPVFHRGRRVETDLGARRHRFYGKRRRDGCAQDCFARTPLPMRRIRSRRATLRCMQPKDPLYQYTDVIILLTDGLNTQNRWSSTQTDTDDRRR